MSFVTAFGEMKSIFGFCPCCQDPFRLSDATLFTRTRPPSTEFDRLDAERERVAETERRFRERESRIRAKAVEDGRAAARRRLRTVAPFFTRRKIELRDVKVLFHPVDYVIFRGSCGSQCLSVDFVDHPATTRERERIQRSLQRVIEAGSMDWQTYRITEGRVAVQHHARRA